MNKKSNTRYWLDTEDVLEDNRTLPEYQQYCNAVLKAIPKNEFATTRIIRQKLAVDDRRYNLWDALASLEAEHKIIRKVGGTFDTFTRGSKVRLAEPKRFYNGSRPANLT